jgi:hypothetical protein
MKSRICQVYRVFYQLFPYSNCSPVTPAYVPYMVNPGNHESGLNFAHYTEFFRDQPYNLIDQTVTTDNGDAPNNWSVLSFSWCFILMRDICVYYQVLQLERGIGTLCHSVVRDILRLPRYDGIPIQLVGARLRASECKSHPCSMDHRHGSSKYILFLWFE